MLKGKKELKNMFVQDFPWIVADDQEVLMQEPRLIPLKTMTSDIVKVVNHTALFVIYVFIFHLYLAAPDGMDHDGS